MESVIALAPNLLLSTGLAVCILVLSKHKTDTLTQFIDASGEEFFRKEGRNNVIMDKQIDRLLSIFEGKEELAHVSSLVDHSTLAANDYNLSVGAYVKAPDPCEAIDIDSLNAELAETVKCIDALRRDIDRLLNS